MGWTILISSKNLSNNNDVINRNTSYIIDYKNFKFFEKNILAFII